MTNQSQYCIYLLECNDGSYYCGITTDLEHRLTMHNAGAGSKYVRSRRPAAVLHHTGYRYTQSEALKIEYKIKQQPKFKKLEMLQEFQMNLEKLQRNLRVKGRSIWDIKIEGQSESSRY